MGHTHEPAIPTTDLAYMNTGCWTRYYQEGKEKRTKWSWDLLRKSAQENFPYELAYAQVEIDDGLSVKRMIFRPFSVETIHG